MITKKSTLAQVEAELNTQGVRLQSSVDGKPYACDIHFSQHAFNEITSVSEALQFCDELDAEDGGHCHKADGIREWLKSPFWVETPERIRAAIARHRRVCCRSHETGSYAKTR